MKYSKLLNSAVVESGWTYRQVVEKCRELGINFSRSYLCKICTGASPPPSDEINKALAEVLSPVSSITYEQLALAKYREIIPEGVLDAIASQQ